MRERFYRFMQGRYGVDQLNRLLMILLIVCLVLSFFAGRAFYLIGLILIIFAYFRMFSRKSYQRSAENIAYLRFRDKIRTFFLSRKRMLSQRLTHHIYQCPTCKQKIRIPRGKGRIVVRCPKCGNEFIRRS